MFDTDKDLREVLVGYIKMLIERAETAKDCELTSLTAQIVSLVTVLHQKEFFDELTWHSAFGWLPKKCLEQIKLEKAEEKRRLDADRERLGVTVRRR